MCCESHECYCRSIEVEGIHIGHIAFNRNMLYEDDFDITWAIRKAIKEFRNAHREEEPVSEYDDEMPF